MDYFVSNSVLYVITLIPNEKMIDTCLRPCIKRELLFRHQNVNDLLKAIKDISSMRKKFKIALKHYLLTHSFYSLDELFSK
jgi:hypothetical protein